MMVIERFMTKSWINLKWKKYSNLILILIMKRLASRQYCSIYYETTASGRSEKKNIERYRYNRNFIPSV